MQANDDYNLGRNTEKDKTTLHCRTAGRCFIQTTELYGLVYLFFIEILVGIWPCVITIAHELFRSEGKTSLQLPA